MMNTTTSTSQHRPAGPIRQLSLQQPIIRRPQQQMRRQRSTDDERTLQHLRVRFSNKGSSKNDQPRHNVPKVRVAWNDPLVKPKNENNVEIVARQISSVKTANRSTTGRDGKNPMNRCLLGEKATILYSRQELAERLRLAWRQREENKCNIDIFLAHNTVEERCDSNLSTATSPTNLSIPDSQKGKDLNKVKTQIKETCTNPNSDKENDRTNCKSVNPNERHFQAWISINETNLPVIESQNQFKDIVVTRDDNEGFKDNNKTTSGEEKEKEIDYEKKSFISINCREWNSFVTINNKVETLEKTKTSIPKLTKESDFSQAKIKRANFQSGLNKAFNVPIVDKTPTPRISSRASSINSNSSQESTRFRRTNSAPPQRRLQNTDNQITTMVTDNDANVYLTNERIVVNNSSRPIKSAPPVKRRPKLNKKRASSINNSKDDIIDDGKRKVKSNGLIEPRSADVVTMVSLISSADSESEMDENSPRDDKLISELRNKLPTTPIIKSSNGLSGGFRKPFKSVSFQQDSFDSGDSPRSANSREDENRASLRARFAALSKTSTNVEDTPLLTAATLTLSSWRTEQNFNPHQTQLQSRRFAETSSATETVVLTDREKRCLAVPIGDIHDKKRKLVRCRSAVIGEMRISDGEKHSSSSDTSQTCLKTDIRMSQIESKQSNFTMQENVAPKIVRNPMSASLNASPEKDKDMPNEPYGQTPKEKECWHLYRRMCDKGVFVSFDTVLRGMLTPTEYRLRQKEVSQNC